MFIKLTETVWVAPQITVDDVSRAAEQGIKAIINNRPEDESPDQTPGDAIAAAAAAAGLSYVAIPITHAGFSQPQIAAMTKAGIAPRWVQGRRYTDDETLEIVANVLAGEICQSLVDEIIRQGGDARGLSFQTMNCLIGKRLTLPGENGEPIDLGRVGEVTDIDRDLLLMTCRNEQIPVLPSVALDAQGGKLNVNADTAAAAVARLIQAEKLVFLSDVPGIFLDRKDPSTLQSHLNAARCRELIREGIIDAGMVPKVEAALEALEAGVKKVHIIDARIPHSVLLEIYSNEGIGTEIVL